MHLVWLFLCLIFPTFLNKPNEWHVNSAFAMHLFPFRLVFFLLLYDTIHDTILIRSWMKFYVLPSLSLEKSKNPIERCISTPCDWIACLQEIHCLLFWFLFLYTLPLDIIAQRRVHVHVYRFSIRNHRRTRNVLFTLFYPVFLLLLFFLFVSIMFSELCHSR